MFLFLYSSFTACNKVGNRAEYNQEDLVVQQFINMSLSSLTSASMIRYIGKLNDERFLYSRWNAKFACLSVSLKSIASRESVGGVRASSETWNCCSCLQHTETLRKDRISSLRSIVGFTWLPLGFKLFGEVWTMSWRWIFSPYTYFRSTMQQIIYYNAFYEDKIEYKQHKQRSIFLLLYFNSIKFK